MVWYDYLLQAWKKCVHFEEMQKLEKKNLYVNARNGMVFVMFRFKVCPTRDKWNSFNMSST